MKSILIIIALFLSGCATQSNEELLKGELYYSKTVLTNQTEIEHRINADDDEIYTFTLRFR